MKKLEELRELLGGDERLSDHASVDEAVQRFKT